MKRSKTWTQSPTRGGRLTKFKGTVASVAPFALAALFTVLVTGTQAFADTIDVEQATAFITADPGDHNVTDTGVVTVDPVSGAGAVVLTATEYTGTFQNNGEITGRNSPSNTQGGVVITGILSGNVENGGSITSTAAGGDNRYVYGIEVRGVVSGTVVSAGTIHAELLSAGAYNTAIAIDTQDVSGLVRNEGSLSAHVSGVDARARGIETGDVTGEVANSGTISLSADTTMDGSVDGIEGGAIIGRLVNTGNIVLNVQSATNARANDGIEVSSVAGALENHGTIVGRIAAGPDGRAVMDGIEPGQVSGRVVNTGEIDLILTGGSTGVDAIDASEIMASGSLVNTAALRFESHATSVSTGNDVLDLGNVLGSVDNRGALFGWATGGLRAAAGGIDLGTVTGNVTNSGDITLLVQSPTGDATGEAILAGDIDGVLVNSAALSVTSQGSSSAESYGILAQDVAGRLANFGTVDAMATADEYAWASGLDVIDMGGLVTNHGAISARAQGAYADAFGVISGAALSGGAFVNTGNVSAVAQSNGSAATPDLPFPGPGGGGAYAAALDLWDVAADASVFNTGMLMAEASVEGTGDGEAVGIYAGVVEGELNNDADIHARVQMTEGFGGSNGMLIEGLGATGQLENSGAIISQATVETGGFVNGTGITVADAFGRFVNNGDVTANTTSTSGNPIGAVAVGLEALDLGTTGHFENNGTINASADGSNGFATAVGMGSQFSQAGSQIAHSGTINVTASGTNSHAYGMIIGEANGLISVTGDISAVAEDQAYAIFLQSGTGTLEIETTATLDGLIGVGQHNVTLVHAGGNQVYRFADTDTAAGAFDTVVSVPNGLWFAADEGGAAPVYTSFDTLGLTPNLDESFAIAGLSDALTRALDRPSSQDSVSRDMNHLDNADSASSVSPYFHTATSRSKRGGLLDSRLGSVSFGLTGDGEDNMAFGGGFTMFDSTGNYTGDQFETKGVLVSAMVAKDLRWADLNLGLDLGQFNHQNARQITGSADASAAFGSKLWSARLDLKRDMVLENGITVTPAIGLLYGQHDRDGYTETGSLANATVDARRSTFGEMRLGAGFEIPRASGVWYGNLAMVHRNGQQPDAISISVLDDSATVVPTTFDAETFGEIALGYEKQLANGAALRVDAMATLGAATETQTLSATFAIAF